MGFMERTTFAYRRIPNGLGRKYGTTAVMTSFADYDLATLEAKLIAAGHKPVHAVRLLRHFYESNGCPNFPLLSIGKDLVDYLQNYINLKHSRIHHRSIAADGTTKLLVGFDNGGAGESDLMPPFPHGFPAGWVSSPIGCPPGGAFFPRPPHGPPRQPRPCANRGE